MKYQKVYVIYRAFASDAGIELPGEALPGFEVDPSGAWLTREQVRDAFPLLGNQAHRDEFLDELFGPESEASRAEYNSRTLGFTEEASRDD